MARIISIALKKSKLEKIPTFKGKEGEEYYNMDVIVNDQPDKFGQDVSVTEKQTKEDRMAKKPKNYIGSGKTVWSKEPTTEAWKEAAIKSEPKKDEGLPF
jgi:hypothetical protein